MAETHQERRAYYRRFLEVFVKQVLSLIKDPKIDETQIIERFENLESLERLERLERLENLGNLMLLENHSGDYSEVPLESDSVIYCDIPYKGTEGYPSGGGIEFNYNKFYEWAGNQNQPVFISEYWMPEDRFECIWEIEKVCLFRGGLPKKTVERLFIPRGQTERGLNLGKQLALELV